MAAKPFQFLPFDLIDRKHWGANEPLEDPIDLVTPAPYVLHTYTDTERCFDRGQCIKRMKEIQARDLSLGFADIRYNFVIGEDSSIYLGRGWTSLPDMNEDYPDIFERSIEIAHIGFAGEPADEIKHIVRNLLRYGIKKNYLKSDLKYITHFKEIVKDEEHYKIDGSGNIELQCYKKLGEETEKDESDDYKVLGDVTPGSYKNAQEPIGHEHIDMGQEEDYEVVDGVKCEGSLLDPVLRAELEQKKAGPSRLGQQDDKVVDNK
ncbi:peptidoglycan-recognition protein LE-like [Macrosteles quadrilineatus]|uniref:peptidoglycan-recognition protein LE-like n=1 Tax=Macrosteles quadrilineatus TaxID=74068 RepID=UPI0023E322EE|nr:peptidoglycan-recognition protein LE-like [Macrosteles quadrilineatus]